MPEDYQKLEAKIEEMSEKMDKRFAALTETVSCLAQAIALTEEKAFRRRLECEQHFRQNVFVPKDSFKTIHDSAHEEILNKTNTFWNNLHRYVHILYLILFIAIAMGWFPNIGGV